MSGKCEHGLTTRECFVCASAKYGKPDDTDARVQRIMEAATKWALAFEKFQRLAKRATTLQTQLGAVGKAEDDHLAARAQLERVVREAVR